MDKFIELMAKGFRKKLQDLYEEANIPKGHPCRKINKIGLTFNGETEYFEGEL